MNTRIFKAVNIEVVQYLFEWGIIIGWACWLGSPYLDLSPNLWPYGGEFAMTIQSHYNWSAFVQCGSCFFWNGFSNGGAPAFIDLHSPWLYPLSILTTFVFGAFNGGKVLLVAGLALAGIAQWWIGKVLKFGPLARLWGAILAVSGGHIIGRMEAGSVPLVLSTAACSLVIPPALNLAYKGDWKNTIALGITFGLSIYAGQGYLQIAMVTSLVSAIIYLLIETRPNGLALNALWKKYLAALVLGLMIAAPLLLPLIHYFPIVAKPIDPEFGTSQPIRYALLNLVVDDKGFYLSQILGRPSLPYLYLNYIGWLPIILAAYGIATAPKEMRRLLYSLLIAIIAIYTLSDVTVLKWLGSLPIGGFLAGIRNPPLIQGFVVPFVITLACIGLDILCKRTWPIFNFFLSRTGEADRGIRLQLKWPILLFLTLSTFWSGTKFARDWISVMELDRNPAPIIQSLKTEETQWVQPPFGDYYWIPFALEENIKFRYLYRPWDILGAEIPISYREAVNVAKNTEAPTYEIVTRPENQYAYITDGNTITPCKGKALGGNVDVTCESAVAGRLIVFERALSGWKATQDGKKISLIHDDWLTVDAPAGKHIYQFRYRPWDAPLGLGIAAFGIIISITILARSAKNKSNSEAAGFSAIL